MTKLWSHLSFYNLRYQAWSCFSFSVGVTSRTKHHDFISSCSKGSDCEACILRTINSRFEVCFLNKKQTDLFLKAQKTFLWGYFACNMSTRICVLHLLSVLITKQSFLWLLISFLSLSNKGENPALRRQMCACRCTCASQRKTVLLIL